MYVCVCVRQPATGPTQHITMKFGVVSSFYPGSEPSQGATQNVDPQPRPPTFAHWFLRSTCTGLFHNCIVLGPKHTITPKFGMDSSFHPGSAPSQGVTQNVGPRPRPLLLLSSLDLSARDYFTIAL